ncbi:MAG: Asp-tRNA(Asn)/Glu-tRNA(Gln) amidotransferase GatCAB subunit A, partial [Phycisphaerae bacterium]|nr:Asp-tRNA(Asn)/Glu-tRNA(Gln) amidotransferase GatCAB subunit A [Phycisphaerae bacterium]
MELHRLTIQQLAGELAKGQLSSRQATEHLFQRIERHDPAIHGYLELHQDAALAQADRIDK